MQSCDGLAYLLPKKADSKSDDQLDLQSLHRVREHWMVRRTAVVKQIRGLLLERGTTMRKGRRYVDQALPGILAEDSSKLSGPVLVLLAKLKQELEQLAEKMDRADESIEKIARENESCRRLVAIPGVGPVTATAIIATIGNGRHFAKAGIFAACSEWFSEEHSTEGKQTLWKVLREGPGCSTLNICTQAVTPAKHEARAAVLPLVFLS